jgi:CheY-like chemotaxis protein
MPGVDGLLGTKTLRAIGGFGTVPIIAITAHYNQQTSEEAIEQDATIVYASRFRPTNWRAVLSRYST